MGDLRNQLIRLASTNEALRPHILPLLRTAAEGRWAVQPTPGQTYTVTTRHQKARTTPWTATFLKYEARGGSVFMMWQDAPAENDPNHLPGLSETSRWQTTDGKWPAYLYEGVFLAPDGSPLVVER